MAPCEDALQWARRWAAGRSEEATKVDALTLEAVEAYRRRDHASLCACLVALRKEFELPVCEAVALGALAERAASVDKVLAAELVAGSAKEWLARMLLQLPPLADEAASLLDALQEARRNEVMNVILPGAPLGAEAIRISVASKVEDWSMADGRFIWHGARALVELLMTIELDVRGKRVLELGSGLGLVGLTCARCGAAAVVLTDRDVDLMEACARSIALNAFDQVSCARLDWAEVISGVADVEALGTFDIILGADIIYEEEHARMVLGVLQKLLRIGQATEAVLVIGDASARWGAAAFERLLGASDGRTEGQLCASVVEAEETLLWSSRSLGAVEKVSLRAYHLCRVTSPRGLLWQHEYRSSS